MRGTVILDVLLVMLNVVQAIYWLSRFGADGSLLYGAVALFSAGAAGFIAAITFDLIHDFGWRT